LGVFFLLHDGAGERVAAREGVKPPKGGQNGGGKKKKKNQRGGGGE